MSPITVLAAGDIVGRPGRRTVSELVPAIRRREGVGFCLANGENAAGGAGITPDCAAELFAAGIDVITSGDHIYDNRGILQIIGEEPRLLRPANFSESAAGRGFGLFQIAGGPPAGVVNLIGRTFLAQADCPFAAADRAIESLRKEAKIIIVDMHAEATSEAVAMGWFLDGRVSAVLGTHTHVQTADETILPNGTAYITDMGMTGAHRSILGREIEPVLRHFRTGMPARFEVAELDLRLSGVLLTIDPETGRALSVRRIQERLA